MLSATCTGARVYGHGKQQRLQVILENTEPGGQQISFGCSQGVCLLTAPSSHPSRGYILVTPTPTPFGQNTASAVGTCSPPQGFMVHDLSQSEILSQPPQCQDHSVHHHT